MKNIENRLLLVLSGILLALLLIFGISFISPYNNSKRNIFTTALVNKKYNINKININIKSTGDLTLYNYVDFWGGEYFDGNNYFYFPVDNVKVNEFINKSQEIISLEKILDAKSNEQMSKYSVDNNIARVSFYSDENCVSSVNFGALNQTMDKVFLWTDNKMTVYAMDSSIIYYLDSGMKFWTDQNIIPQAISKNLDYSSIQNFTYEFTGKERSNAKPEAVEKFPSLRFSEILTSFENAEKCLEIKLSDGNGTSYRYNFYPAITENGDCYIFDLEISPSMLYSEQQKEFIKKMNYCGSLSQWTYNTITKLLQ